MSNFNAITTNVATLAARSATGIYIFEQTGVTVDRIDTNISEVHFNSTTTNLSSSTEDLVTTNQGPIKLLSLQGDIVINPGTLGSPGVTASGNGDILLQTGLSGTLIANADIVSGSGDINVVTRGDLTLGDRLKTTAPGTIYLSSQGAVTISSMNIQGVELGVSANDDILVGQIDVGNAKVWLTSAANIFDNDNSNSTINITASAAILRASEKIGNSGVGTSNSRAITTRVETLSAYADNGIYLQEQDGLSIDRVTSTVQRVYFNSNTNPLSLSQEDLTTTANGPILLQSLQGDIVVRSGTDGEPGISANGSGNVLLQTVAGTILTQADVQSDSGHITLNSFGDLVINEHIRTSGLGTIYLVSPGAISIESRIFSAWLSTLSLTVLPASIALRRLALARASGKKSISSSTNASAAWVIASPANARPKSSSLIDCLSA